ncbi:similar to Saccharomyces cerevisiae YIR037W HYR1 Thiol peroxidase [Maudiozyma barnettii]|uniref:Glutathione peroxidase n=1 Tax=Maudiozyma barnettii TaxID=61262 RepID=A0A8H2VB32_9SACH|nr:uncharacterized protein KABA2_01S03762 [Kazachstania barnettii]CAB4252003.1 similar to Saccharomyces cerevisiae YIR037W HYR1 Thiol peroxidase [Kazachstania barnettii]CAD1778423.1 similar to Saccharomyces cerevisiae YIR037W HYR1 Thiol peroxidase [Kazachstania barnettii]
MLKTSFLRSVSARQSPMILKLGTRSIATSFYDLKPVDKDGREVPFSEFKNKPVLIVNVASKCGFTKQYTDLQKLYDEYKKYGFTIIGFPCNQFKNQEPGSDEEIAHFVETKYGITFPILKKVDVNGENADDVYKFLKSKTEDQGDIKWNFEKFLINKNGNVAVRAESKVTPFELEPKLKELLEID